MYRRVVRNWAPRLERNLPRRQTFQQHPPTCSVKSTPYVSSFFSSQATDAREAPESSAEIWETRTLRLLEAPIGTLDSYQLQAAERTIHFWTAHQQDATDCFSQADAVLRIFQLLDRLSQEDGDDRAVADLLSYQTVSLSVNRWRIHLKENGNPPESLSPECVLEKVESYADKFRGCRPDVLVYNMILDGFGSYHVADLPEKVYGFLDHMRDKGCSPDAITYASAIHALSLNKDSLEAAKQSLTMLETMKHNVEQPTRGAYGAVLGALARSVKRQRDKLATASQAEGLLEEMHQKYDIAPCTICCSHVLVAWTQTLSPQAEDRAQAILNRMIQEYDPNTNQADEESDCKPNKICFSAVMSAHAKHGRVEQVKELLHQLQTLYEQSDRDADFLPNVFCFNALIQAWSYSSPTKDSKTNAQQGEAVLQRMVDFAHKTGQDDCLPNLVSFNLLLRAHSHEPDQRKHEEAANRSIAILEKMKTLGIPPDNISYNSILQSFRKCNTSHNNPKWAQRAEWLVQKEMPNPDVMTYQTLILAVAGNGNAERAERVLRDMCASSSRGVRPDASCFNAVIATWSKSKSPQAGERAEVLLRMMKLDQNIEPDEVTYNSTMACWSAMAHRHPQAAERAWSILRYMQEQTNVKPSVQSYTTCLWALAAAREPQKAEELFLELEEASQTDPSLKPKQITYNALIAAWAKVGHASKAQAIFDSMVARSSLGDPENGDLSLRPNTQVYSTLLHAWANAGDAERAVSILQQMCHDYAVAGKNSPAIPNERCFGSVIDALSRSNHPDAAPQAEACLQKMQEMADGGLSQVRPTVYTFQSLISAWANSDLEVAAQEAERNLQLLNDLYFKHGYSRCRPNVIAYTNTLRAWQNSNRRRPTEDDGRIAVERSEALLAEMLTSEIVEVRPNRITYGTVLQTIADSRVSDKLARAQRIGRAMEANGIPLDAFAKDQLKRIRKSTLSTATANTGSNEGAE